MKKGQNTYLNNKGATMMLAVVIIGILMVFTFSLLLVSYTLYASQSKKAAGVKNAEAANSLSKALQTELTEYVTEGTNQYDPEKDSALWKYLRCNIAQGDNNWPYYNPDDASGLHDEQHAFRYFDLDYANSNFYGITGDGLDGFPSKTQLCIYWMLPEGKTESSFYADEGKCSNPIGLRLFIEVICESSSQSYVVKNEYQLQTMDYDRINERNKIDRVKNLFAIQSVYNPNNITVIPEGSYPLKWKWSFVSRE